MFRRGIGPYYWWPTSGHLRAGKTTAIARTEWLSRKPRAFVLRSLWRVEVVLEGIIGMSLTLPARTLFTLLDPVTLLVLVGHT